MGKRINWFSLKSIKTYWDCLPMSYKYYFFLATFILVIGFTILMLTLFRAPKFPMNTIPASQNALAENYEEFWLWTGVKPQPVLAQARVIYLHQGEFRTQGSRLIFEKQGLPIRQPTEQTENVSLWLTFRVLNITYSHEIMRHIKQVITQWEESGASIKGIQLDFDSPSLKLGIYAEFLKEIRRSLGPSYQLSITGLLDWVQTGDMAVLNKLSAYVDEIVLQTYQDKTTILGYQKYIPQLLKLTVPFKVGIVQNGLWHLGTHNSLSRSPYYQGEVMFLLNPTVNNLNSIDLNR